MPLAYTGQLTDPGTGFIDLRARELDPAIGRFLSADTVQPNASGSQGYNLYAYVANNPTTWVDPSGQSIGAVQQFASPAIVAAGQACARLGWCAALLAEGFLRMNGGLLPAIGGAIIVLLTLVVCTLDDACRSMAQRFHDAIKQYGSAAAAGGWAWGAQATRNAAQNFPQLPQQAFCALGALENMAVTSAQNAAGGSHGTASDYTMAAAWGCATSGSGGGGSGGPLERHHLLPREFEPYFKRAGLDIEDYTIDLARTDHRLKPDGLHTGPNNWNKQWGDFFADNPNADAPQILQQLDKMMREFGLK